MITGTILSSAPSRIPKTVLVLGAGASVDYGFPLGRKLLLEVCRGLSVGQPAYELLQNSGFQPAEMEAFRQALSDSAQPSVDIFLENRKEFIKIGKSAIAATLIPNEHPNYLGRREDLHWYEYMFSRIGGSLREFLDTPISFVTFNYDRSLEYFLYRAIVNAFGVAGEKAIETFRAHPIVHVHGLLDEPDFLKVNGRPYGSGVNPDYLRAASKGIKIVFEADDPDFARARELVDEAHTVCFLGFGYLERNVARLRVGANKSPGRLIGTAMGATTADQQRITALFPSPLNLGLAGPDMDVLRAVREWGLFG